MSAWHGPQRPLKAIGCLRDPFIIIDLLRRMRGIRHRTQGGAYILVDAEQRLYVLPQESTATPLIIKQYPALVVRLYGTRAPTFPTCEQLERDVFSHLASLTKSAVTV